ncbi:MAG TPA: glycosyl hydrolase [Verrucomicrobiae bacterium]|nr:glycosyl hydrolase [Verrucomicrobiae bacterium]
MNFRRPIFPWQAHAFFLAGLILCLGIRGKAQSDLETGWQNPPQEARLFAYWWWLNGNVTTKSIAHDLEQMKAKGFGGAVIIDANGANQWGNAPVPHGPDFFSPQWRELYKYTLREANRLGLEISLNIQSGWNLGGPMVTADDAAKKMVWSTLKISGPANFNSELPKPQSRENFYRDTFVIAYRVNENQPPHRPLENWREKALLKTLEPFSTPSTEPLFQEFPASPGEADTRAADVIDLSSKLGADGKLNWQVPTGTWQIFRFGYTVGDRAYVSTASDNWQRAPGATHDSYAIDVYDAGAFNRYWNAVVAPLIRDAGPLAGKTLKYLHTDSWEIENANWTPTLREEFLKRRGYDLVPWLPVIAGKIVNSRDESDRFLFDFRKTLGELTIDNHYKLFCDYAHQHGLEIHPESGGPHAVPIDAQRDLGWDDVPMSEFWAWSWEHRIGDENRFFVKQPASAAHTYGHRITQDEGFTTIGPNWQERLWNNLKPSFDKALCEGMNRLVWHAFVCSPDSTGIPGQQYFAGTHLNPKVTWWNDSAPFFDYINRCQFLLQRGNFVADVLYYYGDHVPNFAQLKKSDPAKILPGYDYDVITEEALIERASVRDGKIVLPDGMSYRILVLPNHNVISLPVLKKIRDLVAAGATIVGPKPLKGETLKNYPACDAEITKLADELWNGKNLKGRVISNKGAREVLLDDGILPDCEFQSQSSDGDFDYIHRTDGGAEIYFVANRSTNAAVANCIFRVAGKAPELWNPVTGERKFAAAYEEKNGRTIVPLDFNPCGSWFVIFREPAANHPATMKSNSPELKPIAEISGAWTVHFDPKWGGPASAQFNSLVDWTTQPESGIKFYSGTAIYEKTIDVPSSAIGNPRSKIFLDLGDVHELAEIHLNGIDLGIVWSPPFRVDVTGALKPGKNNLEISVVNFWPNRIIGDASLPSNQRFTRTNIRNLQANTPLMSSGLLGPVSLLESQ